MLDRLKFRQSAGPNSSEFNTYDIPSASFFRVLFHFYEDPKNQLLGGGLLQPSWSIEGWDDGWAIQENHPKRAQEYIPWKFNSAYSYLITNDEQERSIYLRKFIELLSSINSESPWYFKSVKGVEEAINRKQYTEEFVFQKERNKITIECLADSVDQRIGTLMDLYRAAVYSWQTKREIIPANLRKFDMSIIVYQLPIAGHHSPWGNSLTFSDLMGGVSDLTNDEDTRFATLDPGQRGCLIGSYKIFEFHNCEFDLNSTGNAFGDLNNENPFETTYTIGVFYDDCYETRYNEFAGALGQFDLRSSGRAVKYEKTKIGEEKQQIISPSGSTSSITTPEYENGQAVESSDIQTNIGGYELTEIGDLVLVDSMTWNTWTNDAEPMGNPSPGQDYTKVDTTQAVSSSLPTLISNNTGIPNSRLYGNLFGLTVNDVYNYQSVTDSNSASALTYNYNGWGDPQKLRSKLF